jgi:hypothetical protein
MHMKTMTRRVLPLVVCVSAFAMLGQGTPPQNRRGAPARGPARGAPPAAQQPAGGAPKQDTFVDPRMERMRQMGQLPSQQEKPSVGFGRASIASLDAVNKLMTDLDAPVTDSLRKSLEAAPFLGEGSVAGDKPLGMLLMAGENQPLMNEQTTILAVPLAAGKSTVASLKEKGGQEVSGKADMVTMAKHTLRRTANYLFARSGDNVFGLTALTDEPFANDYKTPGNLALFTTDLAKLRSDMPDAYKQLVAMGSMVPGMRGGDPNSPNPLQKLIDKIDRLTLALNRDEKNLHLQAWKTPFAVKTGKELPRPAFPAGVIAQMHVVYPDKETAHWLEAQVDGLQDSSVPGPPETKAQMKSLLQKLAALHSRLEGFSAGIAMQDEMPIFYIVDQFGEDVDAAKDLKELQPDVEAIGKANGMKTEMSTYDAGGKTVQRLASTSDKPSDNLYIDVLQEGRVVYATISPKDRHDVEKLKAAGMNGKSNVLCAGVLDLGALANQAKDAMAQFKTEFAGQGITWTVQAADGGGNYMFVDVAVPFQAAKTIGKLARQMMPGGGPGTGGAGAPGGGGMCRSDMSEMRARGGHREPCASRQGRRLRRGWGGD